jgi:uncharacterized protein
MIEVPLTDGPVDLTALREFLRSDRAPANAMILSQLDGFLTGIAVGPDRILPSEWMPVIWGGENPVFNSVEEMQAVFHGITSRYNHIVSTLRQDPPEFTPVLGKSTEGDWIAAGWAVGFMDAVLMRGPAWMPLIERKDGILLMPILLSLPKEQEAGIAGLDFLRDPEPLNEIAALIPEAVIEIDGFWRAHRQGGAVRARTRLRKTPRNARCPCGSGRKYKLCCGRRSGSAAPGEEAVVFEVGFAIAERGSGEGFDAAPGGL